MEPFGIAGADRPAFDGSAERNGASFMAGAVQGHSDFRRSAAANCVKPEFLSGVQLCRVRAAQLIPENALLYGDPLASDAPLRAVEVDPFDDCNHQCPWCFTRPFRGHESADATLLASRLREFAAGGGIAVHYSGGGEPLLYRQMYESCRELGGLSALEFTCNLGLWTGLITNGLFIDRLPPLTDTPLFAFLRISLDATTAEAHSKRHQCSESHFHVILKALEARIAERGSSPIPAIGASFIVDPSQNQFVKSEEIHSLHNLAMDLGLDFIQLKHVHTADAQQADEIMQEVFAKLSDLDWSCTEPWVQRYRPASAASICKISRLIEAWNADYEAFPCCHLYGRAQYQRGSQAHDAEAREIMACASPVCRYASMNELLEEAQRMRKPSSPTTNYTEQPTTRLLRNLQQHGFHPYRLFPSAPDLFGGDA